MILGRLLITAVLLWDADAIRLTNGWYINACISVFFVGHLLDYLTIGRISEAKITELWGN